MFEAYSQSKQRIVNIKDEYDLNEIFLCPNPECGAELKIRSVNGKVKKHFGRLKSTPHCQGCPYDHSLQSYVNNENITKYSLESIFNGSTKQKEHCAGKEKSGREDLPDTGRTLIRTPKQLYYFCVNNSLDTPYRDGLTVGDIVLDSRNLQMNANYRGVSGIRLVIAETIQYTYTKDSDDNNLLLLIRKRTVNEKDKFLKVYVHLENKHLQEFNNYIFAIYSKFSKHHVAILGEWRIDKEYQISCKLQKSSHLIFRF